MPLGALQKCLRAPIKGKVSLLNPESQIFPLILLPDAKVVPPGWAAGTAPAFYVSSLCAFPPPSSSFSLSLALVADPAYRVLQSKAVAGVGWQDLQEEVANQLIFLSHFILLHEWVWVGFFWFRFWVFLGRVESRQSGGDCRGVCYEIRCDFRCLKEFL